MFDFLYVKANSNRICKEISLSSFFFCTKMLSSAFLLDSSLIVSKQCAAATGSLWIPIGLTKIYFFWLVLKLAQKPLYLVGNVLK